MNKEELIQVFEDTKNLCQNIPAPSTQKSIHTMSRDVESEKLTQKEGLVIIEPLDTVTALIKYSKKENNNGIFKQNAVLNMASSKRPGGGVQNGSVAQEECLFRCSNLYHIQKEFYPIDSKEFIFSKNVSFVKNGNYERIEPILADVITMPAINLNKNHIDNVIVKDSIVDYEERMIEKINKIFDIAEENLNKNLILGAWGCGVFKNEPKVVAEFFNIVLEKKRFFFDKIIFAIINDQNSVANNYQIFLNTIKTKY